MKKLVDFILEKSEQKEAIAGTGEAAKDTKVKEEPVKANARRTFWGMQSDSEIPWEQIYYYCVKGKEDKEDDSKYVQRLKQTFNLLRSGKFGKNAVVKTVVDNTINKVYVDEAIIFDYNRASGCIVNRGDSAQKFNAEKFAKDEAYKGLIVVPDDSAKLSGGSSRSSSYSSSNYSSSNYGY